MRYDLPMSAASAGREGWQARAGVFYPLVVAIQAQTRLPLAPQLVASEQDLRVALYWSPLVGLGVGLLWSLIGVMCTQLGLSMFATAAVVVVVMILCGGLCFERALASTLTRGLRRWRETVGQDVPHDDTQLVMISVISLSVVLHVAALTSIDSKDLSAVLVASAVLSRWVLSLGPLMVLIRSEERGLADLGRYLLLTAVVAGVVALCLGGTGVLLMALVGGVMALVSSSTRDVSTNMSVALSVALLAQILVLLSA